MDTAPRVPLGLYGKPIKPAPKDIYTILDWAAVDEAVRLYHNDKVDLAVHPNASLRFANEFVKEFKTGAGAEDGYPVLNPGMALCKAEVFECLHPHVLALGEWARNIRTESNTVHTLVREMMLKYGDAQRNIFGMPSAEAQVYEPLTQGEQVYMKITGERGLDLIAAAAKKHLPACPEKCTSATEMALAQPSAADVQTEMYRMNLQFLQGKYSLLLSVEELIKKFHMDMDDLLLGNTSLGSARTVVDFVDVNLMMGTKSTVTGDGEIKTCDKCPKCSTNKSAGKSPTEKSPQLFSPKRTAGKSPTKKLLQFSSPKETAGKSPTTKQSPRGTSAKSPRGTSAKSPESSKKRAKIDKAE